MYSLLVDLGAVSGVVLLVSMLLLKRLFRVDEQIKLLRSIDESLKQLPAVRKHDLSNRRQAS
jgi:hypothetical protein